VAAGSAATDTRTADYSGEPECWRANVELLDEIACGMEAMMRVVNFSATVGEPAGRLGDLDR
jgi:hypothetical protein